MSKVNLVLVLLFTATNPVANSQTIIPGGDVTGEHWTLSGSPFIVQGDIRVSGLQIDPGVKVQVDPGFMIDVQVALTASGTDELPIVFTATDPDNRWAGLRFMNVAPGSVLDHCCVEYSGSSGIRLVNSTPTIRNCLIQYNSTRENGGGVYALIQTGAQLVLENCRINDNSTSPGSSSWGDTFGGGLFISGSVLLDNCQVARNTSLSRQNSEHTYNYGGGLYLGGGPSMLSHTIVIENSSTAWYNTAGIWCCRVVHSRGGGIFMQDGSLELNNSIVARNTLWANHPVGGAQVTEGSGLYQGAGDLVLGNCVVFENLEEGIFSSGGTASVLNSIVYSNNGGGVQVQGALTVDYTDIQGGYPGTGNINYNPAFIGNGSESSDFRLSPWSPCVDFGNQGQAYDDACLAPGLGTTRNDMGAWGGPSNCGWGTGQVSTFCSVNPNSTGQGAAMGFQGSTSLAVNDVTLLVSEVPGQPGIFYYGTCPKDAPFGNGFRCAGGPLVRLGPPVVPQGGVATRVVDVSVSTFGPGSYYFQFWFRDTAAGGASFNLSDGLEVSFTQ